jgi:hypothetical protein
MTKHPINKFKNTSKCSIHLKNLSQDLKPSKSKSNLEKKKKLKKKNWTFLVILKKKETIPETKKQAIKNHRIQEDPTIQQP